MLFPFLLFWKRIPLFAKSLRSGKKISPEALLSSQHSTMVLRLQVFVDSHTPGIDASCEYYILAFLDIFFS